MTDDLDDTGRRSAESVRDALVEAALAAYDDAGIRGLCEEGRWEAAVGAMRELDVGALDPSTTELTAALSRAVAVVGGASAPPPSGGSVAAAAGALAAALTRMVAGLTAGRPRYVHVAEEMQDAGRRAAALASELLTLVARDAAAVDELAAAHRLPRATEHEQSIRAEAIEHTMRSATEAPLAIARAAAAVVELAADVAERGNRNAVADAAVAALLAEAVCRAAALTVRVNVPAVRDGSARERFAREATAFEEGASEGAARAAAAASR